MKFFRSFLSNAIAVLNVVLVFLFFFRKKLEVPVWMQPLGRMHPMLLHLPIGILMLAAMMILFKGGFKKKSFQNFLNFALYLAAFTAALTAFMGLLLSAEGGYPENHLFLHSFTGLGVSLLTWVVLLISLYAEEKKNIFYGFFILTILMVVLAGHFGSELTHGENFVWQPLNQEGSMAIIINDSTALYDAAVYPILKKKCTGCHNDKKSKGGLIMTSAAKISIGGEHGPIWKAGDPQNSEIIRRIHLPEENDDHMPPSGKPALTKPELRLLYYWVLNGANLSKPWTKFGAHDSMRIITAQFINAEEKPREKHYSFAFASPDDLIQLNTPFCTVSQFALDDPAIKVDFFLAQSFNHKRLEALLPIKDQIVILNLASMPLSDADGQTISQFTNLEKLDLNKTKITPVFLSSLVGLNNLKSLSLAGSPIDRSVAEAAGKIMTLKEIFVWNTNLSEEEIANLRKQFPYITWDAGYHTSEIMRLTAPQLANENSLLRVGERVRMKHSMPGTEIRYTTDGQEPDSVHGEVYKNPFSISGYTRIKAKAFKKGWYGSMPSEFSIFKKGIKPLKAELINPADKAYPGDGSSSLIDSKKGTAEGFKESTWLGFRDKPMIALFEVNLDSVIKTVSVCYANIGTSQIFPPISAELWAGNDAGHLKLLGKVSPLQPMHAEPGKVEAVVFSVSPAKFTFYKIVANPIPRLPDWVSKKHEKGWVFVDEVIFN